MVRAMCRSVAVGGIGCWIAIGIVLAGAQRAAAQAPPRLDVLQDLVYYSLPSSYTNLIQGSDGAFYGATPGVYKGGSIWTMSADGSTLTDLYDLDWSLDGAFPNALLEASDGLLYGTNQGGGSANEGSVFKIAKDGTGYADLVQFDSGAIGGEPTATLIQGADGALYGTTTKGGSFGDGTVFRINTDGSSFQVIANFDGATSGASCSSGLMQASNGDFYGTTQAGGAFGCGTIFHLYQEQVGSLLVWKIEVIFDFDNTTMGAFSYGKLMEDVNGTLYGTTVGGGANGYGTVFSCFNDGSGFIVLHNFDYTNGASPYSTSPLVLATDGALYGVASVGGPNSDSGVAFKLNLDGSNYTVLADFDFFGSTGEWPNGVIEGQDRNFYVVTSLGAWGLPCEEGTVCRIVIYPATWSNYGSGLAGTLGVPSFVASQAPTLGSTDTLTIGDSRNVRTLGLLVAGLSQALVPFKGGDLLVGNMFSFVSLLLAAPTTNLDFVIPDDPSLCGLELDCQVLENDPGAVKGVSLTPGLQLILGW